MWNQAVRIHPSFTITALRRKGYHTKDEEIRLDDNSDLSFHQNRICVRKCGVTLNWAMGWQAAAIGD